jgi:bla regulator protein BlaR1
MFSLFSTGFLQALGYAIVHSMWQSGLLWLIYQTITSVSVLRLSAAQRYRFAVTTQLLGFIWFVITLVFYSLQYRQLIQEHTSAGSVSWQLIQPAAPGNLIQWMIGLERFLPYLSLAYLLLLVFLFIRWTLGYRNTQLIRTQGLHKMPVDWRLFVKSTAATLGIHKEIRVFLSEKIGSPLTMGFWKPLILVPLASINHLSTEQMEAVLLHELAHIRRMDYLLNLLLSVIELILFFNPFTHFISRQIHKERENSCDDWVLQFRYNPGSYAEALLRIASLQPQPVLAMAATGKRNDLLIRVKRMIGEREPVFHYRRQLLALGIVTLLLLSVGWLRPVAENSNDAVQAVVKPNAVRKNYTVEPMTVRVDNPLFNPIFFLSKPLQAEWKKKIADKQLAETPQTKESQQSNTVPENFTALIPSLVDGAIEQAGDALDQLAQAKLSEKFQQSIITEKNDASTFTTVPANQWKAEIQKSLQEADQEIRKAQKEISRVRSRTLAELVNEKKSMERDLTAAMRDLQSLGLDKLVKQSLELAAVSLTKNRAEKNQLNHNRKEIIEEEEKEQETIPDTEPPLPPVSIQSPSLSPVADIELPAIRIRDKEQLRLLMAMTGNILSNPEIKKAVWSQKDSIRLRLMPVLIQLIKQAQMEESGRIQVRRMRMPVDSPKISRTPVPVFIAQ